MLRLIALALGISLVVAYDGPAAPKEKSTSTQQADVSGVWNVEVDLGGNTGNPVFTFKQKGEELTGKYKGQLGEADLKGKVTGNKIEFSFAVGDLGKAVYTGTIENDTMKGKAKYGDQLEGTWTGKRGKKEDK
jgi:hypothetical protein